VAKSISTIIHAGFPKCASSSLQRHFFDIHGDINNLGKPYTANNQDVHAFFSYICGEVFEQSVAYKAFQTTLAPRLSDARPNVVSDERLTNSDGIDVKLVPQRIRYLFGPCKVVLVIRHPLDFLSSLYVHRLSKQQVSESFELWIKHNADEPRPNPVSRCNYHSTVAAYAECFGKDNVLVLLYEQLRDDVHTFISSLCASLDVAFDPSVPILRNARVAKTNRLSNLQFAKVASPTLRKLDPLVRGILPDVAVQGIKTMMRKGGPANPRLSRRGQERIEALSREGNRALVDVWGLPLEKYGYPL
jgi:hypothetical protein